ncbi:MAG: right-handed parallel beta-helix repeat-containing protein [Planctomycetota bacterium]|nr:right-handed parallel beta-helix repeat-containing protein [Planctomycetota bacterium]MDA1140549.1 right-handed parallel beta-helix repeat-containing protein [Planctomycetota bacterium]
MSNKIIITVGQTKGDFIGNDNTALQAAVNAATEKGGGTVVIGPGTYEMHDSLHLSSNVNICGAGEETVLRKTAMVKSGLSADLGYGHFDVSLAEPDKFRPGMGVHIQDKNSGGFYTTVATLSWRDGDRFGTSRFLNHDYSRANECIVRSVYPVISGYHLANVTIESLSIEGNRYENEHLNGCRGGGIFLLQAADVTIRHVAVSRYNGDGISFQQTKDVHIEDCVCEGNNGHGLHPGSGSVRPIMQRVRCTDNENDGIFYCLRVSFSLTEECELRDNGGVGISVGGRDTDHLIRNNHIEANGGSGLYFRPGDEAMAGHRCQFEGNRLIGNCTRKSEGEIFIDGATQHVHLLNNSISPAAHDGRRAIGIVVGKEASNIVAFGNELGEPALEFELRGDEIALIKSPPATALRVGPDAAPNGAANHLVHTTG